MSCELCGRSSCTRSFHSLEEQETFDNIADKVKERMGNYIKSKLNRLITITNYGDNADNEDYIKLSEVISIIDNY